MALQAAGRVVVRGAGEVLYVRAVGVRRHGVCTREWMNPVRTRVDACVEEGDCVPLGRWCVVYAAMGGARVLARSDVSDMRRAMR